MNKIKPNIERKFAAKLAEAGDQDEFELDAIRRIARQINDADLIAVCDEIAKDALENGRTLSKAMAQREGMFSDEFLQAAKAGIMTESAPHICASI